MYNKAVLGAGAGIAAVTTLPNTGGDLIVSTAVAVGAGMLAWGVLYARSR